MWNKENKDIRIIDLRKAMLKAILEIELEETIRNYVRLEIELRLPRNKIKQNIRDVDNFITGNSDGLQVANSLARIHPMFSAKGLEEISPNREFIDNDLQVVEIFARKLPQDIDQQVSYNIVIETVHI
jgi:hypothetical protein